MYGSHDRVVHIAHNIQSVAERDFFRSLRQIPRRGEEGVVEMLVIKYIYIVLWLP
jgi:hypothetical protein